MSDENAPETGLATDRFKSCWSFGNPYSLRFLDDPPSDPPADPPSDPPASLIGADGALVKDWNKQAPEGYEGLRDDKSLSTVKDVWGLSKSFIDTKKMVGAETMLRPNEKWGDDEWNGFYDAGGRPETKEDYNIKRTEGIPEEAMTDDMLNGFQELFHKIGLSKKQVDAIVAHNDALTITKMKDMAQETEDQNNIVQDALRKDWGLAYDQNVHRGNLAIDRDKDVEDDPAYKTRLLDKVNKDPDLIRFASNMGYKFVEHKIVEDPGIPSPMDLQKQIADLMASADFNSLDANVRKRATDKIMRLREQLTKGAVI